ncbi:hypothetical protein [Streptomyces sp. TBY4]|uniref:hypothetical protein n=1 Tax=Streptomyces sp. TBY4 TaxID=2962030 RepID=UPI0020B80561|nr:hypothetical protein [Streptomyces sp. TBY4]MCP3755730.1 hypothetical protein [Streptomyces sp. TBY4]
MALASTGKEIETAEVERLSVDVESISLRTEAVLSMKLHSSTRGDIDAVTPAIVQHMNVLLGEDLGAAEDVEVQKLARKGRALMEHQERPNENTPTFGAWLYLRDVALLTRQLLWIYIERNGLGAP